MNQELAEPFVIQASQPVSNVSLGSPNLNATQSATLMGLLGALVLTNVAKIVGLVITISVVRDIQAFTSSGSQDAGAASSLISSARSIDSFTEMATRINGGLFIVTAIVFLFWFSRVYKNAALFSDELAPYSHGWAIGSWFTPILCWSRPLAITKWIMRGSANRPVVGSNANVADSPLVSAWWTLWVITSIASYIVSKMSNSDDIDKVITQAYTQVGVSALEIVSGIMCLLVVREISRRQKTCSSLNTALAMS